VRPHTTTIAAITAALILASCDGSGGATRMTDPAAKAQTLWDARCAACHGPQGRGDGSAVPGIRIKPPDLTHPAWQDAWSDERIARIILLGGPAEQRSHVMSPNPDLADEPEVVAELIQIIRRLPERAAAPAPPAP
jgi:hypothetical protein